MIIPPAIGQSTVLLTGATGFIGREVLALLLKVGVRPIILVRGDDQAHARRRIVEALKLTRNGYADDAEALDYVLTGDLRRPRLGLSRAEYEALAGQVKSIINVAGSTSFNPRQDGEPFASNVIGLGHLIELGRKANASFHHFSTAFVCGDRAGLWRETDVRPGLHRNAYESSKWEGEQRLRAAAGGLRGLTIYRPAITVPDARGQRLPINHSISLLVNGFRLAARLSRRQQPGSGVIDLRRIRIDAHPNDPMSLVPVGWVADLFLRIFLNQALHGRVYHLVLPNPPTVHELRRALEAHLEIRLGTYLGPVVRREDRCKDAMEERFYRVVRPLHHYFRQSMRFDAENVTEAMKGTALTWPSFTPSAWRHLLGSTSMREEREEETDMKHKHEQNTLALLCREYFEEWVPCHAPNSSLTKLTSLTVDVGFWIEGAGEWTLRFRAGQLSAIEPHARLEEVRTGFRTDARTFVETVTGRMAPQTAFLLGRAQIVGDVETGLKFAVILQQFILEFAWNPEIGDEGSEARAGYG